MAWTNAQKKTFAIACREVGMDDGDRRFILRQTGRAMYDRNGKATGVPSSTSKKLNNSDLEFCMALVEHRAGGRLSRYSRGYWQGKADDDLNRLRRLVRCYAQQIVERFSQGYLDQVLLQATHGVTNNIDAMDYTQLDASITACRHVAQRSGMRLHEPTPGNNAQPRRAAS